MEKEKNKNVIVLRNLPSNLIDEAIVVFKENVRVKKYSKEFDKAKNLNNENVVEEAENVISDYINNIENKKKSIGYLELKNKYDRLVSYSIFSTIFSILCCISILLRFVYR